MTDFSPFDRGSSCCRYTRMNSYHEIEDNDILGVQYIVWIYGYFSAHDVLFV